MKKLREELERAKIKMDKAGKDYVKHSTRQNYDWYQYCKIYYEGLKKAFDLIEGEE